MELTVTQENLSRALSNVSRVASAKAGLPILQNILLRTDGTRLLIAATNLEVASTYHIGAKVAAPGAITIPSRLVSEFVANLPKGVVSLKVDKQKLEITSEGYRSVINGIVADEFPELPAIDEAQSVQYQIEPTSFKQAVSQTIITTSSDNTRPVLTGVFWHTFDGKLYLAATDGYRLSEKRLMESQSEINAIIPATTLQEVLRNISDDATEVDVLFDETQVRFRVGDSEIISRLIDGNYPAYRELIPKASETTLTIDHNEFSRITKVAGLFARDSGGSVKIEADKDAGELRLQSIASEYGENTSSSPAKVSASGEITLNSRYLSEALSVIDGESIQLEFNGKLSPSILTAVEKDPDYKHIIMPLKS